MTEAEHLANCSKAKNFKRKVENVLGELRSHGYKAKIYSSLRSLEEQKKKVAAGTSQTLRSKHLPDRSGKCRAVDIADEDKGWRADPEFWLTLGRCAVLHGLSWGGLWFRGVFKNAKKKKLLAFLLSPPPWEPEKYKGEIGWDPAHIECI